MNRVEPNVPGLGRVVEVGVGGVIGAGVNVAVAEVGVGEAGDERMGAHPISASVRVTPISPLITVRRESAFEEVAIRSDIPITYLLKAKLCVVSRLIKDEYTRSLR